MSTWKHITINPHVMGGKACIRDLRVTVETIVCRLAADETVETVLAIYHGLRGEDIEEALVYAETSGDPSLDCLKGKVVRPVKWVIRLEGRVWERGEFDERWLQAPEKLEVYLTVAKIC